MSKIVWNINAWNGEQDTPYLGPVGCYDTSIGVDIRRNPPFAQSSPAMVTEWTYDSNIILQKNLEDFGLSGQLVCLENGKVYIDNTLKFTLNNGTNAWNKVLNVGYISDISGTPYIYLITDTSFGVGKIHRVPTNFASASLLVNHKEYETKGSTILSKIPVINETTRFIFGVNNKVFELDNQEVLTDYVTLQDNQEMMGITEFQNRYTLYYNTVSSNPIHGYQAFWDGYSYEIEGNPIIHYNYPTLAVTNLGAYDYGIVGYNESYSDFFQIAGSQWNPIAINPEAKLNARKFSPYISSRGGIVYISGEKLGVKGIYTFGSYHKGFPESLTMEFVESVTGENSFLHHTHTAVKSYFSTSNDKILSVNYNDPPANYVNNTKIYTKYYTGNGLHTLKSLDYMYVGYILPSDLYSIKIYARKDSGSFKLLKTINDSSKEGIMIGAIEFKTIGLGDFYRLQMMFDLVGPTNPTGTPQLGNVLVFMNDNYNK